MIICSDWPTTLRCGIILGYKKNDGIGRERKKIKIVEIGRQMMDDERTTDENNDDENAKVDDERRKKGVVIADDR
jgi:hypothetical protein